MAGLHPQSPWRRRRYDCGDVGLDARAASCIRCRAHLPDLDGVDRFLVECGHCRKDFLWDQEASCSLIHRALGHRVCLDALTHSWLADDELDACLWAWLLLAFFLAATGMLQQSDVPRVHPWSMAVQSATASLANGPRQRLR